MGGGVGVGVEGDGEWGGQAPRESASPVAGVQVTTHAAGAVRPIPPHLSYNGARRGTPTGAGKLTPSSRFWLQEDI